MKAIRFEETGPPSVLKLVDVDLPDPGPGEVRLRHTAIGFNMIDTYFRKGLYPTKLPAGLGGEAAGVVEAVGAGVTDFKVGDRAAYGSGSPGIGYAEASNPKADNLVKLPDGISEDVAAAIMLKGMTAQYLLRQVYPVKAGETIVFTAVSGGVGQIACQWAKHLGVTVIGTVGTEEKAEMARQNGCDYPIFYKTEDLQSRIREITNGEGVPVVYDSIGKSTFEASLNSLRRRGLLVSFGNSSGPPPLFNLLELSTKGSLGITRVTLVDFVETPQKLRAVAQEVFDVILNGAVKIKIGQEYPLADVARLHTDAEAGETIGASLIRP